MSAAPLVRRYVAWYESHPRERAPAMESVPPPTTGGAIPVGLTLAEHCDDQEMGVSSEMVWIDGGEFRMGDARFYPEERPVHRVAVDGFWIDEHPVTNGEFSRFVADTGHLTFAERQPDTSLYPEASPGQLVPGSIVFRQPAHRVGLDDWRRWWEWVPGASWRHPDGPASSLAGLEDHPVVHVAHEDAEAYARWAGKQLPTEAQWEYAARGGEDGAIYAWGDEPDAGWTPAGEHMAGRVPLAEPRARRVRAHVTRRLVPTERLRPPRRDRERLGVDGGLVHLATSPGRNLALLHAAETRASTHRRAPASMLSSPAPTSRGA